MPVLTEDDVRKMIAHENIKAKDDFYISNKQIITPSARAYLLEKNINLKIREHKEDDSVKPEHMTHLRGNTLVFKDHPRIAFRGAIDSLESEIILVQVLSEKSKLLKFIDDLEEIVRFIRLLLRCEVVGEPLGDFKLQGLTPQEIREHSHHPSKYYGISHFLPGYKQGELPAQINRLRTKVREVELIAYKAFKNEDGKNDREDIIKALNRLSSLFWIMMFKYLSGQYN